MLKPQPVLNKQAKSDMSCTEEIKNLKIILLENESFQSFLQVSFMYYFSSHFLTNIS
jgi:predicted lactoylglutathione lyase